MVKIYNDLGDSKKVSYKFMKAFSSFLSELKALEYGLLAQLLEVDYNKTNKISPVPTV